MKNEATELGTLASCAGNTYIKVRVRDWYGGQKVTNSGGGREERKKKEELTTPLFARLGPSARSFAPFCPRPRRPRSCLRRDRAE